MRTCSTIPHQSPLWDHIKQPFYDLTTKMCYATSIFQIQRRSSMIIAAMVQSPFQLDMSLSDLQNARVENFLQLPEGTSREETMF